ncbi:hypothetical protein [Planktotalea sp.]|uniref:hypothetical protein n=1 Tax=Planktotalea sp. TaxID=2029877 RepID=UPI003D6A02FE
MKAFCALAGVIALGLPVATSAQEIEASSEFGVNVATSGGGTTETTASLGTELSFGGAFIGGSVESLYQDPVDKAEVTLTFGYGFDLGNDFALTASYARIYLDKSGFASHEVAVALDFPVSDNVGGTLEVVHDLTADNTDVSLSTEFGLGGNFTGAALVGYDGAATYGELGVSYAFNDNISTGLVVEMAENTPAVYNFGVTFGF